MTATFNRAQIAEPPSPGLGDVGRLRMRKVAYRALRTVASVASSTAFVLAGVTGHVVWVQRAQWGGDGFHQHFMHLMPLLAMTLGATGVALAASMGALFLGTQVVVFPPTSSSRRSRSAGSSTAGGVGDPPRHPAGPNPGSES